MEKESDQWKDGEGGHDGEERRGVRRDGWSSVAQ